MDRKTSILQLDDRLRLICDMVRPGVPVADIGTDHGYLIGELVAIGKTPCGYACDVNAAPLEKARKTAERLGLSDRITCVLSDGLDGLLPEQVQDVVIAGMGGDLMAEIIARAGWLKSGDKHLVLQPMSKAEHLRDYLYPGGFRVGREVAVQSGDFVYTVLSVKYDGVQRPLSTLTRAVGEAEDPTGATEAWLQQAIVRCKVRLEGLRKGGHMELWEREQQLLQDIENRMEGIFSGNHR